MDKNSKPDQTEEISWDASLYKKLWEKDLTKKFKNIIQVLNEKPKYKSLLNNKIPYRKKIENLKKIVTELLTSEELRKLKKHFFPSEHHEKTDANS